jgi:Protein of unknown function (DUF3617)
MLVRRATCLALALSTAAALPALAADTPSFKVKPGLWQMTTDSERSGTLPIPDATLARMTPEQRARLEASMQQSMAPRHGVTKECVTQADIDKGFEGFAMGGGQCTRTVTERTATVRAGTFSCTGRENSSGSYRFEATSAEAMVGKWDAAVGEGGKTMNMKAAIQGKWLGADCGDVKPREPHDQSAACQESG